MVKYLVSTHRPWFSPDTADKSLPIAPEARLSFPDPFMGLQLSRQMSSVIREFFLTWPRSAENTLVIQHYPSSKQQDLKLQGIPFIINLASPMTFWSEQQHFKEATKSSHQGKKQNKTWRLSRWSQGWGDSIHSFTERTQADKGSSCAGGQKRRKQIWRKGGM